MPFATLVLTATIAANASVAPAAKHTAAECAVWDREVSLSQSFERRDKKAIADHLFVTAVFSSDTSGAFYGADEIVKALWVEYVDRPAVVRWRPVSVSIGKKSDHAIVTGIRVFEDKSNDADAAARYMSWTFRHIWRLDPDSKQWKIEYDGAEGEIRSLGSTADLDAELARAPKTCPR